MTRFKNDLTLPTTLLHVQLHSHFLVATTLVAAFLDFLAILIFIPSLNIFMKLLLLLVVFLTGCVCLNPDHRQGVAPSVETDKVIEDLKDTKEELVRAGEANTQVGKSVDKALTLAEKLDAILEEIERSQNKNVIK